MKKIFIILALSVLASCDREPIDSRVQLKSETENKVELGDTLVVFTHACKGCEFETTHGFSDSLGLTRNVAYRNIDICPECDGGSYRVEVEFVALRTGKTVLKMYQHNWTMSDSVYVPEILDYEQRAIVTDSILVARFPIDVSDSR